MTENSELTVAMDAIFEMLGRMETEQRKFHKEAISLLESLASSVQSMDMDTSLRDTVALIERDVSIIADRHRPNDDDGF